MRQSSVAVKVCGFGAPRFTISFSIFRRFGNPNDGVRNFVFAQEGIFYFYMASVIIFVCNEIIARNFEYEIIL